MASILAISGSLRAGSLNRLLMREAIALAPAGLKIEEASIAGIPLYNADEEEADGFPAAVIELQDRLAAADGLLLVTPEYNAGIPGVTKNAIDWLSRSGERKMRCFSDLPVALIGAGAAGGTRSSQAAWLPVLRMLGARLWSAKSLFAARAWELFDQGALEDEPTREQLGAVIEGFAGYLERFPRQHPRRG